MKIQSKKAELCGTISVPGSKSHTIRALLLAAMAEGTSYIHNPLPSADCLSASKAILELGASADLQEKDGKPGDLWIIKGAGKNLHLPSNVVDVGNSGSVLYFLSPIAATFEGWSIFTGDPSIRTRPVKHLVDMLSQVGAEVYISRPGHDAPPVLFKGPVKAGKIITDGRLSQYVTGMMMAATRLQGETEIILTDPKETPYLTMTKQWLEAVGAKVFVSEDFKRISVQGKHEIKAFDKTVPSDWEAVAFPLIAALISKSKIVINNVDCSGSQGDDAIVSVLKSIGADIQLDSENQTLTVTGGKRLSTENLENNVLKVNLSGWPDGICAMAVIACFVEGKTILEDLGVCRRKETDRIKVMCSELTKLGADITEGEDYLVINGHSPKLSDGSVNPDFKLTGGSLESFDDHRVAMSLACLGLGLPEGTVEVNDAECCEVSFPNFFNVMNSIKAGFDEFN